MSLLKAGRLSVFNLEHTRVLILTWKLIKKPIFRFIIILLLNYIASFQFKISSIFILFIHLLFIYSFFFLLIDGIL